MVRGRLSRDKVLDAALRLVADVGLDGLSMRRLAAELGVEAMSLYHHVDGKGDLLDGVVSRVFEAIPVPDPGLPPRDRLRALGRGMHAEFAEHPHVVRALVGNRANPRSPAALRVIDAVLGALLDTGLDERDAVRRYRSLLGLVFGAVLVASPGAVTRDARGEPIEDYFRRTAGADTHPNLRRALPALLDAECTPDFGQDLRLFLDALTDDAPGVPHV